MGEGGGGGGLMTSVLAAIMLKTLESALLPL